MDHSTTQRMSAEAAQNKGGLSVGEVSQGGLTQKV